MPKGLMFWKTPVWQVPAEGAPAPVPAPAPASEVPPSLISGDPAPAPAPAPAAEAPAPVELVTAETLTALLPEGFTVPDGQRDAVLTAINEGGTPQETAKRLFALYAAETEAAATAQAEQWNNTQKQWQDAIRNAPEYSGEKLAPALARAKDAAIRLGGQELLDTMALTGMGNNVHMLRALLKAADLLPQEATPAGGDPAVQPKSLADKIFGGTK